MQRASVPLPPILRLSRALHGAEDIEHIMDRVREFLTETTRYRYVYVHLFHPSGTKMEIAGWVLPGAEKIRASLELVDVARDPFLQRFMHTKELVVMTDLRLERDADQAQVEATGIRTTIAAPMFDEDAHLGPLVVCTFSEEGPLEPTTEELDLISQIAALVGTVIARVRARKAQVEAETRLARAAKSEALGRMAGEVAHDFNNVLFAIVANLELARGELEAHSAVTYLDDALAAAERATALTRQLLATSRGQPLARRGIQLARVVDGALKLVLPTLGPRQVLERLTIPEEEPIVLGDPELLERVVVNLLVNARDAIGPNGRISVEARTVLVDGEYVAARDELRPGHYALIIVSDDGAGMDADTLTQAFDPFFTTKDPERGTGLGLSVVQGITQQHDGYVNVYSEVGHGTAFKVYLPLAAGQARSEAPVSLPSSLRGSERVLVLDDDAHVRKTVELVLTREGYRTTSAATEAEGLALLAAHTFDVLLTDVMLGSSSGPEVAQKALALQPALRTVFMTGYTRHLVPTLNGPTLLKPFSVTELLTVLRTALA